MFRRRYNLILNQFFLNRKNVFVDRDVKLIFQKHKSKEEVLKKYGLTLVDANPTDCIKNIKNINFIQFLLIYKILFTEKKIVEASEFREKYLVFLEKKSYTNFDEYLISIKTLIDSGKFNLAYSILSKFQFKLIFSISYYFSFLYLQNIKSLMHKIVYKAHGNFNDLNVILKNKSEEEFVELIKGKTLALVGPGYSEIKNGNEIDSFDLVIRMNIFKDYTNQEKLFFGSKTDIIYFNGEMFTKIERDGLQPIQIDKFLCSRLNFSQRYSLKKNRSTRKLNLNLSGTNGFLQDVVTDLLHYEFKKIKIFNFDFFLNSKLYFSNYSKPNDMKIDNMYLTQSKLDLFSNINFIRNLNNQNLIEVDTVLKSILAMSNKQIADKFKKIYD